MAHLIEYVNIFNIPTTISNNLNVLYNTNLSTTNINNNLNINGNLNIKQNIIISDYSLNTIISHNEIISYDFKQKYNIIVFNGKYLLNMVSNPILYLIKGNTYIFDLDNITTDDHPFYITTSSVGGTNANLLKYDTGVSNNGSHYNTFVKQVIFTVPNDAPNNLYYHCGIHSDMGNKIHIISSDIDKYNNYSISNNISVAGNATIHDQLVVANDVNMNNNISVAGNATIHDQLVVANDAIMNSNINIKKNSLETIISHNEIISYDFKHKYNIIAFNGKYLLNMVSNPILYLIKGNTYIFDLDNITTDGHPFYITTSSVGGTNANLLKYDTGVSNNGSHYNTSTKQVIFTVPDDAPDNLYYHCGIHSDMGNIIYIIGNNSSNSSNVSNASGDFIIQKNLNVSGNAVFNSGIILGNSNINPTVNKNGTIRYTGNDIEGYISGVWKSLTNLESNTVSGNLSVQKNLTVSGNGIFNDKINVKDLFVSNNVDINRNLTVSANCIFKSGIILGNSNINPAVTELGTIRYSGLDIEGYLDGTWKSLTSGGSGGGSSSSKSNTFQLNNITQTATYLKSIIGFSIHNSTLISRVFGNNYQIINSANSFDTLEINISHPNLSTNPLSYSLEIYINNNLSQTVNITIPQNSSETLLRTITNLVIQQNNKLQLKIKALDSASEGGDIFISLHNINTTIPTPVENRITSGLINSDVFQLNSITQSYINLETMIGFNLENTTISEICIKDYQIITNPNIYNILEVNIVHNNITTNSLSYNLEIYINNIVVQTVNISIPQNSIQTVLVSISELEVKQNDKLQLKIKANDVISEGGNIFISLHGKNIITTTTTSIQDNFSIGKNLTVSGNGIFNDSINVGDLSVSNELNIGKNLTVSGNGIFNDSINVGDLSVSNTIGIGTSTVETSLDVDSSLKVFDILNDVSAYVNTSSGDYMKLQATSRTDTSTKKNIVLNPDGGNVGIGTDTPQQILDVNGNIKINRQLISDTDLQLYGHTNKSQLALAQNFIQCNVINAGNGQLSPRMILHDDYVTLQMSNADNTVTRNALYANRQETLISCFHNNHGNNPGPTIRIHCAHSFTQMQSGTGAYIRLEGNTIHGTAVNSVSDDRYKHNEEQVNNALSTINKLNILKYDKTTTMLDANFNGNLDELNIDYKKEVGIIAQDIKNISELEFCVSESNDPINNELIYAVNYNAIYNIGIKAIQELSQKNDTLETKNTELETEVLTLKTQLADILTRLSALETN